MTIDLWMLVASVGLTWVIIVLAATPAIFNNPAWGFGNRDTELDLPAWAERADRTANNLQVNLILFASLVLVAHVSEQADATSALGAQIFFGARVAHAVVYVAGIHYLRTLCWFVSIIGMFLIASSLF
jgi:uncharacterized MAPEG superfamily protein